MRLYFMRHAEAETKAARQPDTDRALSEKGRRQAEWAGKWFADRQIRLDAIACSPRVRACQTADAVAQQVQMQRCVDCRIDCGRCNAEVIADLVEELEADESMLVVGHEPDLSSTVQALTAQSVRMSEAAIAVVLCDEVRQGSGILELVVWPDRQV